MARPKREPDGRVNTGIRFPADLHARMLDEATAREVSMNWLVTRLCAEGMERLIPLDEMTLTVPPREPKP